MHVHSHGDAEGARGRICSLGLASVVSDGAMLWVIQASQRSEGVADCRQQSYHAVIHPAVLHGLDVAISSRSSSIARQLASWLAGWLAGQLAGWLAGWLAGSWLAGRQAGWLASWLVYCAS